MILRRLLLFIVSSAAWISGISSPKDIDSLISVLDHTIKQRHVYIQQKEDKIKNLQGAYLRAHSDEERFNILGEMADEYGHYNTDSALAISKRREDIANANGNPEMIIHAQLTTANTLTTIGMYKEALDIMDGLIKEEVPADLKQFYYHVYRTLYGLMTDYAIRPEDKEKYSRLTDLYRDSLIAFHKEGTFSRLVVLCDNYNAHNQPHQSIKILSNYLDSMKGNPHTEAITAYTLSESYRMLGDTENQLRQLLISANGDMQSATKEYISLRKLAVLLFEQDDLDHAYKYLHLCMEDALECNARLRMLEANDIYNIVSEVYMEKVERQNTRIILTLILVGILAILLVTALFFLFKKNKKLTIARKSLAEANDQLNSLNENLKSMNQNLIQANQELAENSSLKEEYIAQYMDQCTEFIDKLDTHRKTLTKISNSGSTEELKRYSKSLKHLDTEIENFYNNFDNTFLKLFPTFVEDFNALLLEEERIIPKNGSHLNTELRIFALIRLGITDSNKIAHFLRYSLTTIYNYRTRVRNKAKGDRDGLEEQIMSIGKKK